MNLTGLNGNQLQVNPDPPSACDETWSDSEKVTPIRTIRSPEESGRHGNQHKHRGSAFNGVSAGGCVTLGSLPAAFRTFLQREDQRQRNSPSASCWACSSIGTAWPGSAARSLCRNWAETREKQHEAMPRSADRKQEVTLRIPTAGPEILPECGKVSERSKYSAGRSKLSWNVWRKNAFYWKILKYSFCLHLFSHSMEAAWCHNNSVNHMIKKGSFVSKSVLFKVPVLLFFPSCFIVFVLDVSNILFSLQH